MEMELGIIDESKMLQVMELAQTTVKSIGNNKDKLRLAGKRGGELIAEQFGIDYVRVYDIEFAKTVNHFERVGWDKVKKGGR